MPKMIYNVTVLAEGDDGSRLVIGQGFYPADDVLDAHVAARNEHWDERMSGHYLCVFQSEAIEDPCWFCAEAEATGECGVCGVDICMDCHIQDRCCDG